MILMCFKKSTPGPKEKQVYTCDWRRSLACMVFTCTVFTLTLAVAWPKQRICFAENRLLPLHLFGLSRATNCASAILTQHILNYIRLLIYWSILLLSFILYRCILNYQITFCLFMYMQYILDVCDACLFHAALALLSFRKHPMAPAHWGFGSFAQRSATQRCFPVTGKMQGL